MSDASFVFTRDLLSLPDLTVSSDIDAYYILETFGRPGRTPVNTTAQSGLTHGEVVIRSRLEQTTIPLTFFITGGSTSVVESRVDQVEACLTQFYFSVTCDIDGVARGYACDPSAVSFEDVDAGMVDAHLCRVSAVLSVYPLASS